MRVKNEGFISGRRWRASCVAAAASTLVMVVAGCGGSSSDSSTDGSAATPSYPTIIESNLNEQVTQIGGATTAVAYYDNGTKWTLYSMANRFAVTSIGTDAAAVKAAVKELVAPGYIQRITVLKDHGVDKKAYALLSMGGKGIGVVDITNPAAPVYVRTMTVDYASPSYMYSDGGGTVFTADAATHTAGPVNDLLVYDDQATPTADTSDDQLLIANGAFGIQKTKLSNLMGAAADGALPIDGPQLWTLKYAGENPMRRPAEPEDARRQALRGAGLPGHRHLRPGHARRAWAPTTCTPTATNTRTGRLVRLSEAQDRLPRRLIDAAANVVPMGVDADGMPTYLQAADELGNKNSLHLVPLGRVRPLRQVLLQRPHDGPGGYCAEFTNWHDQDGGLYRLFAGRPGGGGRHRPDGTEV